MNQPRFQVLLCCMAYLFVYSAALFADTGLATSSDQLAAGFLSNANMARGTKTPSGWSLGSYHKGNISLIRDTRTFKSAPASLCVDNHDAEATGFVFQALEKNPTAPIDIGCFIKVSGKFPAKSIQMALQVFDAKWHQISWIPLALPAKSSDWQHMGASATLPKGAVHALLGVSFSGNGKIWIDDVSVKLAAPEVNPQGPLTQPNASKLPVHVSPYDQDIHYVGRFDTSQPSGPRCAWPASSVTIRFSGTDVNAKMAGGKTDYWQIIVDSHPTTRLRMTGKPTLFRVASGLSAGTHEVTLVKLGEPIFGTTRILGFELGAGGTILPVPPNHRRFEVIGDSISAGYGDEAPNQYAHFSAETENAYMAYGAVAARAVHAEYVCIAWSGKCLWPHNTIPAIYNRTLPQMAKSRWKFSIWKPQAVLINLGTNDFAGGNPAKKGWIKAYEQFVDKIRSEYPGVTVFCALSPMLSDPWSRSKNARSTCRKYLKSVVAFFHGQGHQKVHFLDFPMQNGSNGFGADWHPSVKEHKYMATIVDKALSKYLGW